MPERRRGVLVAAVVVLGASALVACGRTSGAVIRVDSSTDTFAASMIDFFPDTVVVHPGDTVRFRQRWTGEPHSVTFGASFNEELGRLRDRLREPVPPDAADLPELAVIEALPAMLGREGAEFVVNQNGAQPCYLDRGAPPTDPDTPCPRRKQPEFTGRHSYYSSGFIPFGGEAPNRFDVRLSKDIAPGSYNFYCNLHGVGQSGTVEVIPSEEPLPSRSAAARRTQELMTERYGAPLAAALTDAQRDELTIAGVPYRTPLAGAATTDVRPWGGSAHRRHFGHRHGSVDEFVPPVVRTGVDEPVTWTFVGRHTVSFNVPRYLPVFAVDDDGTVRLDPLVHEPVGWAVPSVEPNDAPAIVDAGRWDGRGFRSTGLDWRTGDQFTVRFTRRGTFLMACLVHPAMVGKVVVS